MSKKIATHDGVFHADEVFAIATLYLALEGENLEVVRTRDPEIVNTADFCVDVGFEYNPEKNRFDHHQSGGAGERKNGIGYASFGLVWNKYSEMLSGSKGVALSVDRDLVQIIDAGDNGIDLFEPKFQNIIPLTYKHIIEMFVPKSGSKSEVGEAFIKAVDFAKFIIKSEISFKKSEEEARKSISSAYSVSEGKRVIVLDKNIDWEYVASEFPELLFIVYPDSKNDWRVKVVRENRNSFIARKNMPSNWAGRRNEDFIKETGVKDALFCHRALFTCGAMSKEGAIALAKLAVDN